MRDGSSPIPRSGVSKQSRVVASLQRVRSDPGVRAALFSFLLTRIAVIVLLIVGSAVSQNVTPTPNQTREVNVSFKQLQVARALRSFCTVSDPGWYNSIARWGYEKIPFSKSAHHNWAFFPLFPLTWRIAAFVTREYELTGIVLSHIFFFFALLLVHRTIMAFGFDEGTAARTVFYIAIFPTSFFFSLPMSESLFLLLTAGSICCARLRRWWLAGLLAALASATRATGILLMPTLALMFWQTYGPLWRRREVFSLLLAPLGLIAFMIHLHFVTGDALAFAHIQEVWGRRLGFFGWPLIEYLQFPTIAVPWDLRIMNFAAAIGALASGVVLLKWRQWALGFYTLAAVILTLSSLLLIAQARYAMVLFPVHLTLAIAGRNERINVTIRVIFAGLLFLMTALYAANFSWLR
jgi:Mannosyltransferase (PIG-V)